jgi:DNA-binding GntR family transcriptional regulator
MTTLRSAFMIQWLKKILQQSVRKNGMRELNKFDNHSSKQEFVYQKIKKRILDGRYHPGMMLVERNLCGEFDVSRTPIREALRRLESDSFVKIIPQKGVFVTEISIENMLEIFELREALEKMAVKLFLQKAGDDTFEQLEKCYREQTAAYEEGRSDLYMIKDMEFHLIISKGSNNARINSAIQGIYDLVSMLAVSVENDPVLLKMAVKHHTVIMDAIKRRNSEEAEAAMAAHIITVKDYHITRQLGIAWHE